MNCYEKIFLNLNDFLYFMDRNKFSGLTFVKAEVTPGQNSGGGISIKLTYLNYQELS